MSEETETIARAYELGYLVVPTASDAEIPALVEALKGAITAAGGDIKSEGAPEFIDLAYQMERHIANKKSKYTQGYFGWLKFEAAPEAADALKKALDANDSLIRYLLVKTNLENNVVFKKPKIEAKRETAVEGESEALEDEDAPEETQEDHELLPDLEEGASGGIIEETPAVQPEETESKEAA